MTSNDKPCVHMDSLVVLHNISNGQLVDVLVLRGLIRQTPSINLWNKLGCQASVVRSYATELWQGIAWGRVNRVWNSTQYYHRLTNTALYLFIYYYISYMIYIISIILSYIHIAYLCINRVCYFSIITASRIKRYAAHLCGITFPTKKRPIVSKAATKLYDQLKLAQIKSSKN